MTDTQRTWYDRPDKPGLWWYCHAREPRSLRIMDVLNVTPGWKPEKHTAYTPVLDGDLPTPPPEKPPCCPHCGSGINALDYHRYVCGTFRSDSTRSDLCRLICTERQLHRLREKARAVVTAYFESRSAIIEISNLRQELGDK